MKIFKLNSILFLFYSNFILNISSNSQTINTNKINESPTEIYGNHKNEIKIKISNGGAGPTGIIKALAEDYLSQNIDKKFAIAWYQNISLNSLNLLKGKKVDIALVYEPIDAHKSVKEGLTSHYTLIFYDHFLIVGPKKNKANINRSDSPSAAFAKIAKYGEQQNSKKLFLSRNDFSGTNIKERLIWTLIQKAPFEEDNSHWYFKYSTFPMEALLKADKEEMYTITDWGTWLNAAKKMKNTEIFIRGGDDLLNPCVALLQNNPSKEALDFLSYLKSDRAQKIIANHGKEKFESQSFFTSAHQPEFENKL
ncbi:substrate-binding domain-containing protein [Silvanigrella aquatica]|uniref:PBP domain-containing protein n=1 Tax=Silvanigrella aquatica TaxID=1915309 RepID=A0A1L4D0V2_9BACT|nr:substrate-binding domain-containing protein [Silvanigrella aquatica]APJ03814.1 hypothetical protein AXG55_07810 [Silvanigrella aquatica]